MGFYGNISNTTKVQFSFDRIFSSRSAMDDAVNAGTDSVFAGKFVLVSYDKEVHKFSVYYLKTGNIYLNLSDAEAGRNQIMLTSLEEGTIVRIPLSHDLAQLTPVDKLANIEATAANVGKYYLTRDALGFYSVFNVGTVDDPEYQVEPVAEKFNFSTYYFINENHELELIAEDNTDNPYLVNYLMDTRKYGSGRGYDGTVWQKVYIDGEPRFAMVAELNSIVPTLAITTDAPTVTPKAPHFDVDSSNVYYKLHIQPTPGLWIKPAKSSSD